MICTLLAIAGWCLAIVGWGVALMENARRHALQERLSEEIARQNIRR